MKRLLPVFIVIMLGGSIGKAEVGFGVGPHAGVSFSSFQKQISDFYGTGFLFGAHGDVSFLPYLSARLSLDYTIFSADKDKVIASYVMNNPGTQASEFSFEGAGVSIFSVYADGKGKIPTESAVTPYGLLGLGLNFISTSEGKVTYQNTPQPQANIPSSSETKFGLNFGAGAEFALSSVVLYLEFKYAMVFTSPENSSHIPIVFGATFPL